MLMKPIQSYGKPCTGTFKSEGRGRWIYRWIAGSKYGLILTRFQSFAESAFLYKLVIIPKAVKIEDITWPRGNTNFVFEC